MHTQVSRTVLPIPRQPPPVPVAGEAASPSAPVPLPPSPEEMFCSPSPGSVFIAAPGDGSSTETWLQNKQLIHPALLAPPLPRVCRQGPPTLTSRQEPAKPPCPVGSWFGDGVPSQAPSALRRHSTLRVFGTHCGGLGSGGKEHRPAGVPQPALDCSRLIRDPGDHTNPSYLLTHNGRPQPHWGAEGLGPDLAQGALGSSSSRAGDR